MRITAANRGPDAADLHLLPTLWFRNDWSQWIAESNRAAEKPDISRSRRRRARPRSRPRIPCWANSSLSCEGDVPLLFTENETNHERLFRDDQNESPLRQGRHQRLCRARPAGRGESRQAGHEGRGALPVTVGAGQTP